MQPFQIRQVILPALITVLWCVTVLSQTYPPRSYGCIQCSTKDDPDCYSAKTRSTSCSTDQPECYTRLVDGHVERGCTDRLGGQAYLKCLTLTNPCNLCRGFDGCNNMLWPRCQKCSETSTGVCAEEQPNSLAEFCSFKGTVCYARLSNGLVTRGCTSDYPGCLEDRANCQMCNGDGCNGLTKGALKPSKCQQCHSSDDICTNGTSDALTVECTRLADPCFTTITQGNLQRGCLDSIGPAACTMQADARCGTCHGENCNKNRWHRCYQCKTLSSIIQPVNNNCEKEQTQFSAPSYCKFQKPGDACYTRKYSGYIERGCRSDLGDNFNPDDYEICFNPGCNSQSGSACQTVSYLVILALAAVIAVFT